MKNEVKKQLLCLMFVCVLFLCNNFIPALHIVSVSEDNSLAKTETSIVSTEGFSLFHGVRERTISEKRPAVSFYAKNSMEHAAFTERLLLLSFLLLLHYFYAKRLHCTFRYVTCFLRNQIRYIHMQDGAYS